MKPLHGGSASGRCLLYAIVIMHAWLLDAFKCSTQLQGRQHVNCPAAGFGLHAMYLQPPRPSLAQYARHVGLPARHCHSPCRLLLSFTPIVEDRPSAGEDLLAEIRRSTIRMLAWLRRAAWVGAAISVAAGPSMTHAAVSLADVSLTASNGVSTLVAKLAASGFLQAFSLVFVSEIGDKTFFIAGLLAMKTSRLISFSGSMAALTVMTIISVVIGQLFHAIPSPLASSNLKLDQLVAVIAFAYFGLKTIKESYAMPDGVESGIEDEKAEAEKAIETSTATEQRSPWSSLLQIFSLVFAAEFGDRSFLSTIALGAAQNPFSVATGAIGAHATATGIAVASGAFLSKYLSEKVIGYIGGALFLVFAVTTAIGVF